jgi:NTE family protein
MKADKTWALVLMGGGARGLAHVGVLRVLENEGLVPDVVAGTSMGAIVGGFYAAGVSAAEMTKMLGGRNEAGGDDRPARRLFKRARNVFEYVIASDYKNRILGKIGGKDAGKKDAVEAYLKECVGEVRIEDLPVKFLCNAVDLVSGREVVLSKGKLHRAIRASMSLPLVFAPVKMGRMLLIDGGVLSSAPVEAARAAGAEVAVLVDVHRPINRMPAAKIKSAFQVVQRTVEVASAESYEERAMRADFVVRVPVDLGILEFSEAPRIAAKGARAAAANLEALKKAIGAGS